MWYILHPPSHYPPHQLPSAPIITTPKLSSGDLYNAVYLIDIVALCGCSDVKLHPITGDHFDVADISQHLFPWWSSAPIGECNLCIVMSGRNINFIDA